MTRWAWAARSTDSSRSGGTEPEVHKEMSALRWAAVVFFFTLALPPLRAQALLTVAEKSDFKATSKHADVVDY